MYVLHDVVTGQVSLQGRLTSLTGGTRGDDGSPRMPEGLQNNYLLIEMCHG